MGACGGRSPTEHIGDLGEVRSEPLPPSGKVGPLPTPDPLRGRVGDLLGGYNVANLFPAMCAAPRT